MSTTSVRYNRREYRKKDIKMSHTITGSVFMHKKTLTFQEKMKI